MKQTLEQLEQRRRDLYSELTTIGDFRRGIISVNYRKCANPTASVPSPDIEDTGLSIFGTRP